MQIANDTLDSIEAVFQSALSDLQVCVETEAEQNKDMETIDTALHQLLDILYATDKVAVSGKGLEQELTADDITSIGDHGMKLIAECADWATQLERNEARMQFESISYPLALWVARHGGKIETLDTVVNGLAAISNQSYDADDLEVITAHTGQIIHAANATLTQDRDRSNPQRPWRILHLNYGITATRTHNTSLMEESFETLVHNIPDDADDFFREGMEQMEALDYPIHVRAVMEKYFTQWSGSKTLH